MAAANMKAVKLRMKSIQSTMQITKAMELVASSKLRKAKERADASRPYFGTLRETLTDIALGNTDFSSCYTKSSDSEKWCYVVIAGDRGLAATMQTCLRSWKPRQRGRTVRSFPLAARQWNTANAVSFPW